MRLALNQALRSLGNTKENPSVGCIITKNNHAISAGFTSKNGRPHAEQNAIRLSKSNLKNSNIYITLEPCSHYGKTAPCVNSIIKNQISRVYFSINDPDIRSFNKATSTLRNKRVKVSSGIFKKDINFFYRSYFKFKKNALPFVTCKLAISKDFYTISKGKKWITNRYSRGRVHLMRSNHDCVLTSSQTIIRDNPRLSCRINGLSDRSPQIIILDNKLRIPLNSKIIKNSNNLRSIIFYNKIKKKKIKLLKKLKVKMHKIPTNSNHDLDLEMVLLKIKKLGFSRIFLESGIKLTLNFLSKNLVDDFKLFISNNNLGTKGSGNIRTNLKRILKNNKGKVEKINLFGDKLISYKIK